MDHHGNAGEEGYDGGDGALIISHDGAVHRDTVRRWKDFSTDVTVDWVRMAQNVLRYNVVIVGKFFNKSSRVSEAWKKEHPEDFDEEEHEGHPERIATAEERMAFLNLEPESAVCVRSSGTPPPHGFRLTLVGRGNPILQIMLSKKPTILIIYSFFHVPWSQLSQPHSPHPRAELAQPFRLGGKVLSAPHPPHYLSSWLMALS